MSGVQVVIVVAHRLGLVEAGVLRRGVLEPELVVVLESSASPEPWVALLPALDATTMGWAERDWYLGPHRAALFDRAGNAGPTIWVDGRIVGGWTQGDSAEIAPFLLEDVGRQTQQAIDQEAARLAEWMAPAHIRWTFPPPRP